MEYTIGEKSIFEGRGQESIMHFKCCIRAGRCASMEGGTTLEFTRYGAITS